jgi:hypothetical protein
MDEPDYPAAHSMDTAWFAIDRDGCVALFWSGDTGLVPASACFGELAADLHEALDAEVRASREQSGGLPVSEPFRYRSAGGALAVPYERSPEPRQPMRAAELPKAVAAIAVRVEGSFAQTPALQPAELWECRGWEPGWVSLDGAAVRPWSGREAELAEQERWARREGVAPAWLPDALPRPQAEYYIKHAARPPLVDQEMP